MGQSGFSRAPVHISIEKRVLSLRKLSLCPLVLCLSSPSSYWVHIQTTVICIMARTISRWPAWPEFEDPASGGIEDTDFLAAKQQIIAEYGVERLVKGWIATCKELQSVTDEIISKRDTIIPILSGPELLRTGFSNEQVVKIKRTGCLVVRQIVPRDEADELYVSLKQYVSDNREHIQGWPAESPSMLVLYDSPTQNAIRAHPNQLKLQRMLNELWHGGAEDTSSDPLVYMDGVRDRPPKQSFLGLPPHIDAGSLSRWADPAYRHVYDRVFGGEPEKNDPWDLGLRRDAIQDLFPGPAHSAIFRTFQGWTALTRNAPKEGTLLVVPNLNTVLAYVLLRPFFKPPTNPEDVMDASLWSLDDSGYFPGTSKPQSQPLSRSSHPHLRLEECLTYVPTMEPGDTVWWHTDVSSRHHPKGAKS